MADERILIAEILTMSTIISILFTTAIEVIIQKIFRVAG